MNKIIKSIALITMLYTLSLTANGSVYTDSTPDYESAWSTYGYYIFFANGTYKLSTKTQIAVKYNSGEDAGKWIVLPPTILLPQGVNDDINWAVNYVITNNIPARWGICLQIRTVYNVTSCLY